jgi:hypothetical protein
LFPAILFDFRPGECTLEHPVYGRILLTARSPERCRSEDAAVTAEELKEMVRKYADEHCPGWTSAGVVIQVGEFEADGSGQERLHVSPPRPAARPPRPSPATRS